MGKSIRNMIITTLMVSFISSTSYISANAAIRTKGDFETVGKNFIQYMANAKGLSWNDVKVVNSREIYDFNGKEIGYCVDLKNNKTNDKAYVILSNNEEDEPVSELAFGRYSPYNNVSNDTVCIYDGVLNYYSKNSSKTKSIDKSNDKILELITNSELDSITVKELVESSKKKVYKSTAPSKSKLKREKLSNSVVTRSNPDKPTYTILKVPDYKWQRGCSPTSAAMILKYRYPSSLPSSTKLIDELADEMHTITSSDPKKNGSTEMYNIPYGIEQVGKKHGFKITSYNDDHGRKVSTYSEYCAEINKNTPPIVTLLGSSLTAPSYPNGFESHSMAGVGYQYDDDNHYLIVHDTMIDGDVYCNFDSSALGTNVWTYIH